jgi:transaldolase
MSAHTTEAQAAIVRNALKAVAGATTNPRIMTAAMQLTVADDETLASLARKLR